MAQYLTGALQDRDELAWLVGIFKREGVRSYLEIGSRFGGSLWVLANAMPKGSRVVSVDLPTGSAPRQQLEYCVGHLKKIGYDARLMFGNSNDAAIIGGVAKIGPFDACLIDADHSLDGVTRDWSNYGPMARMVVFHDIAWRRAPEWQGSRIDVPQFWNEIKGNYRHEECRLCPTGKNNGIGVLWRC